MRVIGAEAIDAALDFPSLVAALEEAFRSGFAAPVRHHHAIPRGAGEATLLLMPAWSADGGAASALGVKVVSVFPENGAKGLPSVLGAYLLMDGATGAPRAVLDGMRLTLWRTAAASALAARHLARQDARRMVMVGAGALAPFLIGAHMQAFPIERVALWNHRPEKAAALAAELSAAGRNVVAADDLEAAVREADIVSCATLTTRPLVRGAWLKPGTHLDLVGAFNLSMREADDEALRRAKIFIDTPAAKREGGDVALGLRSGAIAESDIVGDLAALVAGTATGRAGAEEITLFKSVGAAVEDLAAALLVWEKTGAAPSPV